MTEAVSLAKVLGQEVLELPDDLYIPPDALRIFLETFEGPLDLLLYLIRKQNLDILDIPIAEITRQYMSYVDMMKDLHFELAAEYLVMAAMLAEIKSRMLLPKPKTEEAEEEEDPRAALIRRLQEYERFKKAAEDLDQAPRVGRDIFIADAMAPSMELTDLPPEVDIQEILRAFYEVMQRAKLYTHHEVRREVLSVRERMSMVLASVNAQNFTAFTSLFRVEEGRMGVAVTLIAVLELIRQAMIELVQPDAFAPIYVRGK
jgi:segregation and condensation protein A